MENIEQAGAGEIHTKKPEKVFDCTSKIEDLRQFYKQHTQEELQKLREDLCSSEMIDLSQEQIEQAKTQAEKVLYDFISSRFNKLRKSDTPRMYLGPSLDLSKGYTVGNINWYQSTKGNKENIGSNAAYWDGSRWDKEKKVLLDAGFPEISAQEMKETTTIGYEARRDIEEERGDLFGVAKHFPGGDERLLQTHISKVHYEKENPFVQESINAFREIITSEKPPKGIMLSLATYEKDLFPGIDTIIQRDINNYPHLQGIKFEDIPASFNPFLLTYLKEDLGYKGVVMPDWIGGMKGCDEFLSNIKLPFINKLEDKKIYFSIMTGSNFVTGFSPSLAMAQLNNPVWVDMKEYPEYYNLFIKQLRSAIKPFSDMMPTGLTANMDIKLYIMLLMAERNSKIGIKKDVNGNKFSGKLGKEGYIDMTMEEVLNLREDIQKHPGNKAFYDAIISVGLEQNDVWNRSGVQALIYRANFVKEIYKEQTGKDLEIPTVPSTKSSLEGEWLKEVMGNKDFRSVYDKINWNEVYK